MIRKLIIKNVPCFNKNGQECDNFAKINFLYGANGSGKTTISEIIANAYIFPQCSIEWENNIPLKTLVYNKPFAENNLFQADEIKGVFTLGEKSKKIEEKITENKKMINKIEEDSIKLNGTKEEKIKEQEFNENWFIEKCWSIKRKYDTCFLKAFEGYMGSKNDFKSKVLSEIKNNNSELKLFEDLKEKSETIFKHDLGEINDIDLINLDGLDELENSSVFFLKIIGKEDVNIAEMIKKLNNSDWVQQGIDFYKQNNDICPFCQKPTASNFNQQLEDYFDDTYNQQLKEVKQLLIDYKNKVENIVEQINDLLNLEENFLDKEIISKEKEMIEVQFSNNENRIENKIKEPSIIIKIDSIVNILNKINNIIANANNKIEENNKIVKNIDKEKTILISQIWCFIISDIDSDYQTYMKKNSDIKKAIESISEQMKNIDKQKRNLNDEIDDLESKIVSIKPTINAINKQLSSFGFTSFKLKESEKKGNYKLIRENGDDAKTTLSEGEKTFISFLYFYYLLYGSADEDSITTNKIVVFDDPICSLDSDILFIVSNLIKNIIKEVRSDEGIIKQVFVFTHNVYFHNEVTFISSRENNNNRKDTTFKILRKSDDISTIYDYDTNPIKSSYELLWQEVREAESNPRITIPNTLRRIIENYFKILGGIDEADLVNKFEGKEKIICRCLISWMNEGSHIINDDLYIESSVETQAKYLEIFKNIFKKSDHIAHYNMMMKKGSDSNN